MTVPSFDIAYEISWRAWSEEVFRKAIALLRPCFDNSKPDWFSRAVFRRRLRRLTNFRGNDNI